MSWNSDTILHDDFCPWYEDRCTCGKEADLLAEVLATTPVNEDPGPATTQSDWYMYVKALVHEVERLREWKHEAEGLLRRMMYYADACTPDAFRRAKDMARVEELLAEREAKRP